MPVAAVPSYLPAQLLNEATPGLRFGMYLPIWTDRNDQERAVQERANMRSREGQEVASLLRERGMEATIQELCRRDRHPLERLWTKNVASTRLAWQQIIKMTPEDRRRIQALAARHQALATAYADRLSIIAVAIAPFTTGLGNEHPLENGFSFLSPYGLPYLPGSGVKGVLRRAAQELASGAWNDDSRGWSTEPYCTFRPDPKGREPLALSMIDALFGREPPPGDKHACRGALSFWDVIPDIDGDKLLVEIMTPHQSHYYQQRAEGKSGNSVSPHDSGQPNPILFLTVPPGSRFHFHVVCDRRRLERYEASRNDGVPSLLESIAGKPRWQALLEAAFGHAFDWLGFGAKTAVGYGAMARDHKVEAEAAEQARQTAEEQERAARRASMSERMVKVEEFEQWMRRRSEELKGKKENLNAGAHNKARSLAKDAQGDDWTREEKCAAADAIEHWLPIVVDRIELKEERKKLGLRALRGEP